MQKKIQIKEKKKFGKYIKENKIKNYLDTFLKKPEEFSERKTKF